MKLTIKIILVIAWILILPICIFNPEQIVWRVALTALWIFIAGLLWKYGESLLMMR